VLSLLPALCGQTFLEAKDRDVAEACVVAYNDWMVEEWCGDSDGHLLPLCLIPLWDAAKAAAEVRRNAVRGCEPCASARSRPTSACPPFTVATGIRSSPRAKRPGPSCACTSARRRRCRRPRRTRQSLSPPRSVSATPCRRCATFCSPASSSDTPNSPWLTRRDRSAGSPTSSSEPTMCGASIGLGAGSKTSSSSRRRIISAARSTGASFAISTASTHSTPSGPIASRSRPITPIPIQPGPTPGP